MTENRDLQGLFRLPNLKSALGRTSASVPELARQVRQGIQRPLDFPGFSKFLFSGDRVALAVHSGIPEVELVLNPLLDELLAANGLGANQLTLLFADRASAERFSAHATPRHRSPAVFIHEGTSEQALALLGADDGDLPILVNRLIFDADVLIPIIRASDEQPTSRRPAIWDFVDSATKKRWHSKILQHDEGYGNFIRELAGAIVIIEVVVGPGDFPYDVVIGTPAAADLAAAERQAEAWRVQNPVQTDLIIATIDDRRDRESWQAIRDSIVVAAELGKHCPIVVVSDACEPPPNELRGAFSAHSTAGSRITRFDSELQSAVEGRRVYLVSKLDAAVVRDLGMMSIADAGEVESLASRFTFPVLLRDAQRVPLNEVGLVSAEVKQTKRPSKLTGAPSPPARRDEDAYPLPRGGGEGTKKSAKTSLKLTTKKAMQTTKKDKRATRKVKRATKKAIQTTKSVARTRRKST